MLWEIIHLRLLNHYESVMKAMCIYQNFTVLPKHQHKKINQASWTICYIEKITTIPKGKTVDTTHLKPGEIIHMDLTLYIVTSIQGFTSMNTAVCVKNIMIWVFPITPKHAPDRIILFILIKFQNEKHPYKLVRVDADIAYGKLNRCYQLST